MEIVALFSHRYTLTRHILGAFVQGVGVVRGFCPGVYVLELFYEMLYSFGRGFILQYQDLNIYVHCWRFLERVCVWGGSEEANGS